MTISNQPSADEHAEALISVNAITKTFRSKTRETKVLDTISFSVSRGSLLAIVGPSGSGKSTLLNILTGIDWPTSGMVTVANQDIGLLSENQLASWRSQQVGIIFQFFQLLPTLTAQENILLALEVGKVLPRSKWRDRSMECLTMVGLEKYAGRLPSELSGGEQQRVAIARALANDPELVMADEPTGNLDSRSGLQVLGLLEDLNRRGKTIIYVTHDSRLAVRATKHLELLDGRLVNGTDALQAAETSVNGEKRA